MKTDLRWGPPVSLESAHESRVMRLDGKPVGELARYFAHGDPENGVRYAPHLYDDDRDLGEFEDAWEAMVALEVAVGVRPVGHKEAWGLPLADEETAYLDEKYGVKLADMRGGMTGLERAWEGVRGCLPDGWEAVSPRRYEHEFGIVYSSDEGWRAIGRAEQDRRVVHGDDPIALMHRLDEYGSSDWAPPSGGRR